MKEQNLRAMAQLGMIFMFSAMGLSILSKIVFGMVIPYAAFVLLLVIAGIGCLLFLVAIVLKMISRL